MTTKPNDGGPAFPVSEHNDPGFCAPGVFVSQGMTLRDWFAGEADHDDIMAMIGACHERVVPTTPDEVADLFARMRYKHADAMLKAREQQ